MKQFPLEPDWPESWKTSHYYDSQEIWGEIDSWAYYHGYCSRRDVALRLLTEAVPKGGKILDVAAGQGNFSLMLAERGYEVTWNDLRDDLVPYVRKKWESGRVEYKAGDVFQLKDSAGFDAVFATEIIEHVAHPDEFLLACRKLVKPGGSIVMTTPNGAFFKNRLPKFSECADPSVFEASQFKPDGDGHIFLLYPEEIVALAEKVGCRVDKMVFCINPLTAGFFNHLFPLKIVPGWLIKACEKLVGILPIKITSKICIDVGFRLKLI